MKSAFIDDGYTIEAWLDETEDSPRIDFAYRRPLDSAVRQHLGEIQHMHANGRIAEAVEASFKFVARYLVKWNQTVDPSPEALRKLKGGPFGKLYAVMLGGEPDGIQNGAMADEAAMAKNYSAG